MVYPDSEAQVTAIAQAARSHGVVLMPCGGGTNVSEALRCLTKDLGEFRSSCAWTSSREREQLVS